MRRGQRLHQEYASLAVSVRVLLLVLLLAACAPDWPLVPSPPPNPGITPVTTQPSQPEPALPVTPTPPPPTAAPTLTSASTLLARMTAGEKAGQAMMIGFDGTTLTPALRDTVIELHVGGVIIFERNVASPEALARLTADLQAVARENGDPPLFIAIDQEGGRVARLKEPLGFTEFPSAMAVGATGDPENARQMGRAMAEELLAVGININFAPDLDVNNNPANPVIGIRSFGSDPQRVGEFGVAFAQGLQSAGVLAVGKHFPGHGDTDIDSHIALPTVPHAGERLHAVELAPFKAAIENDIAGIMSAHVTFPAIEPTPGLPATLSSAVLTGLLREELKYRGLAFTDSLEMGALAENGYPVPVAAASALQAGADVLLFNHGHDQQRAAHALILARLTEGQLDARRLEEAAGRVLAAKERFGLLVTQPTSHLPSAVGSPEGRTLSRHLAEAAITLLRNDGGLLPIAPGRKLTVIEPRSAQGLGKALAVTTYVVSDDPSSSEIVTAAGLGADGRLMIVVTLEATRHPGQARVVARFLDANLPVVVVAVRGPYDLLAFPQAPAYLASYGANPPLLEAAARVLRGEAPPRGRLPVELPGLFPAGAGLQGYGAIGE